MSHQIKSLHYICSLVITRHYIVDAVPLPESIKKYLRLLESIDKIINNKMEFRFILTDELISYFNLCHVKHLIYVPRISISPDITDVNLFVLLIYLKQDDICAQLVEYIDCTNYIDVDNCNILMIACVKNLGKLVYELIDKFPLDYTDIYGRTALMLAAGYLESPEAFDKLVNKDKNPFRTDVKNWSAICFAAMYKRWSNVLRLLDVEHIEDDVNEMRNIFNICVNRRNKSLAMIILYKCPRISCAAIFRRLIDYPDLASKMLDFDPSLKTAD